MSLSIIPLKAGQYKILSINERVSLRQTIFMGTLKPMGNCLHNQKNIFFSNANSANPVLKQKTKSFSFSNFKAKAAGLKKVKRIKQVVDT